MRQLPVRLTILACIALLAASCNCRNRGMGPNQDQGPGSTQQDAIIRNELIIRFADEVNLDAFTETYLPIGLELRKPLDPQQTMWLAGLDTLVTGPEKMLSLLREDRQVDLVEFNKRVQLRQ